MGRLRRSWTEPEDKYLREQYMQMSDTQLGEAFGRTECAVKNRRVLLNLRRKEGKGEWRQEENTFLEEHYWSMSLAELSEVLGRTEGAVRGRARALGLYEEAQRTKAASLARCDRCIWEHRQGERRYCPFGRCVDGRL